MPTSDQVAAFRAMLHADFERYQQLAEQLDANGQWSEYGTLIGAAFALAVRKHLGRDGSPADVIKLVAELRTQFDPDGDSLDPHAFELLVRSALGEDVDLAGVSDNTVVQMQVVGVGGLAAAGRLGDVDEFAERAEALADKWSE